MSHYPSADPETKVTVRRLRAEFAAVEMTVAEHRGDLTITVPCERVIDMLRFLRDDAECRYGMLTDLCGVDLPGREPRFEVVYHLYSLEHRHRVRIKVGVPEARPIVETAIPVWKGADWFERECYDLLGILFRGHPDLRRLLTHDDFQGHALRKDYDQRQRWRCTKVSNLDQRAEVPPATTAS